MKSQKFTGIKGLNHHISVGSLHADSCIDVRFDGELGGVTDFGGFNLVDNEVGQPKMYGFYHTELSAVVHIVTGSTTKIVQAFGSSTNVVDIEGNTLNLSSDAIIKIIGNRFYITDGGKYYRIEYVNRTVFGTAYSGWYFFEDVPKKAMTDWLGSGNGTLSSTTEVLTPSKLVKITDGYIVMTDLSLHKVDINFRRIKTLTKSVEGDKLNVTGFHVDESNDIIYVLTNNHLYHVSIESLEIKKSGDISSDVGTSTAQDLAYDGGYLFVAVEGGATGEGIYRYNASTLAKTHSQTSYTGFTALCVQGSYVYGYCEDGDVYKFSASALVYQSNKTPTGSLSAFIGMEAHPVSDEEEWLIVTDQGLDVQMVKWSYYDNTVDDTYVYDSNTRLSCGKPWYNSGDGWIYFISNRHGLPFRADEDGTMADTEVLVKYGGIGISTNVAEASHDDDGNYFYAFSFVLTDGQELMLNMGADEVLVLSTSGDYDASIQFFIHEDFHLLPILDKIKIYRASSAGATDPQRTPETEYLFLDEISVEDDWTSGDYTYNTLFQLIFHDVVSTGKIGAVTYDEDNEITRVNEVIIPSADYIEVYGGRMYFAGLSANSKNYKDYVIWTPELSPDLYYWLDDNQVRLDVGAVSDIYGMAEFRGMLAVITDSNIAVINGFEQIAKRPVVPKSPYGLAVLNDYLYIVVTNTIYRFDGYNFHDIGFPIFHPIETQITQTNLKTSQLVASEELQALFFNCGTAEFIYYTKTDDWSYMSSQITGKFIANNREYYLRFYVTSVDIVTYTRSEGDYVMTPEWKSKKQAFDGGIIRNNILMMTFGYKADYALRITFNCDGTDRIFTMPLSSSYVVENLGLHSVGGKLISFKFDQSQDGYQFDVGNIELFYQTVGFNPKGGS